MAAIVAGAGVVLCVLALLWPEAVDKKPFALAIGIWPGMETLTLAREHGRLPEQEVNFVELSWTSATMMAFENRVVDGAVVTLDEMLRLKAGGHAIKAVLVLGTSSGGDAVLARSHTGSLKELRSRRIGVEMRASGEYLLSRGLAEAGMTLADVELVPLNLAEAETAFEMNEVDALVTMDPALSRLTGHADSHAIYDSRRIPGGICRVLVVREDFLETRGDILRKLVSIHFDLLKVLHAGGGQPGMDAVLRREQLSKAQFARSLERLSSFSRDANLRLLDHGPSGLEPVLKEMAAFMAAQGLLEAEPPVTGLLDARLIRPAP